MRLFLIFSLLFTCSAFASVTQTEIYKVVGLTRDAKSEWVDLKTLAGPTVYVRCETMQFDDVTRDRVGGFRSTAECEKFLTSIEKYASRSKPVDVWIGENFQIEMRVNR